MNHFPRGRCSGNSLALSWLLTVSILLTATAGFADYTFTDVTPQAGVANADHAHFGAAWCDYDSDGWLDLYVVNDDDNTLYRNQGTGSFADVTAETGTGDPFVAMRNVCADYDADGDIDIYSHNFGRSTLYQNNENVFVDVSSESGAGLEMPNGTGAAWVDYDRDGWLDIHATGFPGWNVLLHSNGDGTFTDLQAQSGLPFDAAAMGTAWADYDGDGDQDLAVAAVPGRGDSNFLYRNNGNGTFTNTSASAGIVLEAGSSTSAVTWGDYDNDGLFDLFITEVALGSRKSNPNRVYLFRNLGNGTFLDVTSQAGLELRGGAFEIWDAAFADYDNDGDLDLYIGVDGPNSLYQNNGDGTFTDIAAGLGLDRDIEGKALVWGDYDNDGDLDLYLVQRADAGSPLVPDILFRNDGGTNRWLQVKLIGSHPNLDAIGARITVVHNQIAQMREINGGSGFFSQHSPIQQFGFGPTSDNTVDEVRIRWSSGVTEQHFDVPMDTVLVVTENASAGGGDGAGPVNSIPFAANDSSSVDEGQLVNIDLAANDSDADDGLDLASINIVDNPSNGSISAINTDGTVDYRHNGSATVADSFTYTVDDHSGATSNLATVSITINPTGDPTGDPTGNPTGNPSGNPSGISDAQARALGLDPNDPDGDTDNDMIADITEIGGDVNNPLDGDADGVIDALEPGADAGDASVASGLPLDGGSNVTIRTAAGERLSRVSSGAAAGGPAGVDFPLGTVSYTTTAPLGGSVTLRLRFSNALPGNLRLFKVDNAGVFTELPGTLWTPVDTRTVDVTLTDGDPITDLDGIPNGLIDDPVAVGSAAAAPISAGDTSGGGGGCALNRAADGDPSLPLLILASLAYLLRRWLGVGRIHL